MSLGQLERKLVVVVGGGGVGKTTLAAALGLCSARRGANTLVMTFDPSLRLKDALGVGESARDKAVRVKSDTPGLLEVILLDARSTFDRLIERYAPDKLAAERIYANRFYRELAGNLSGILEYMAVERLFEVATEGKYDRIILDTPPTRQALDFLEAPARIMSFLDSGAVKLALNASSTTGGRLKRATSKLAMKGAEGLADKLIGTRLLQEMLEFFRAFAPLYDGFRQRAEQVSQLLRDEETLFTLVSGPGEDRIPDTMFFARKLAETGHRVGPVVVNQVMPEAGRRAGGQAASEFDEGLALLAYLGERDSKGIQKLRKLLKDQTLVVVPLRAAPPSSLGELEELGEEVVGQVS
jgi:anion-transporting  ArsA/GET3 family ATPase